MKKAILIAITLVITIVGTGAQVKADLLSGLLESKVEMLIENAERKEAQQKQVEAEWDEFTQALDENLSEETKKQIASELEELFSN